MKRDQEVRAEHRLALQLIDIGDKVLATKLHPDKDESRDRAYHSWPLHLPLSMGSLSGNSPRESPSGGTDAESPCDTGISRPSVSITPRITTALIDRRD
jgi:hypothetical protein